jgi:hypothetical protein
MFNGDVEERTGFNWLNAKLCEYVDNICGSLKEANFLTN